MLNGNVDKHVAHCEWKIGEIENRDFDRQSRTKHSRILRARRRILSCLKQSGSYNKKKFRWIALYIWSKYNENRKMQVCRTLLEVVALVKKKKLCKSITHAKLNKTCMVDIGSVLVKHLLYSLVNSTSLRNFESSFTSLYRHKLAECWEIKRNVWRVEVNFRKKLFNVDAHQIIRTFYENVLSPSDYFKQSISVNNTNTHTHMQKQTYENPTSWVNRIDFPTRFYKQPSP